MTIFCLADKQFITQMWSSGIRSVPDFGSGSGQNPTLYPNPVEIRLQQKSYRSRIVLPDLNWRR